MYLVSKTITAMGLTDLGFVCNTSLLSQYSRFFGHCQKFYGHCHCAAVPANHFSYVLVKQSIFSVISVIFIHIFLLFSHGECIFLLFSHWE